jgi:hypothetical protein
MRLPLALRARSISSAESGTSPSSGYEVGRLATHVFMLRLVTDKMSPCSASVDKDVWETRIKDDVSNDDLGNYSSWPDWFCVS